MSVVDFEYYVQRAARAEARAEANLQDYGRRAATVTDIRAANRKPVAPLNPDPPPCYPPNSMDALPLIVRSRWYSIQLARLLGVPNA